MRRLTINGTRSRSIRGHLIRPFLIAVISVLLAISLDGVRSSVNGTTTRSPPVTETHRPQHRHAMDHNCTPAAIEQFPRPLMDRQTRLHGGLAFDISVALLTFLGLAIICDDYFVPSLEKMCDVLHLKPDVAGATFMAAGSSAPELATSVIAVFITKDDIGVGTVVGSAVFNIMFVVGICGLWTVKALILDWWPITRDCVFYLISIFALLFTISDEMITWYESVVLLALYVAYCVFMYYNTELETTIRIWFGLPSSPCKSLTEKSRLVHAIAYNSSTAIANPKSVSPMASTMTVAPMTQVSVGVASIPSEESIDSLGLERVDESESSVLNYPESTFYRILWIFSLPLIVAFYVTVPDCRKRRWCRWYLVTFVMSLLWLSALSYFLVWEITVIGYTLSVPDTVMGLTFLAAGVSVPDAIASLLVIKDGQGDMAVSNAIGSNVFDILLCLGLPWFLQTVIVKPNSIVPVISKGLTYSTVSLFSTVVFLLAAVAYNRWKLDRPLGVILMVWYLLFMVLASLYELNVFGKFNPPTCHSDY